MRFLTGSTGADTQREALTKAEADSARKRGQLDEKLALLHKWTVQGQKMARSRYRDDDAALEVLKNLAASGKSREDIVAEAREWHAAWEQLDKSWAPTKENTFEKFTALRDECARLNEAYVKALAAEGTERGRLWKMLEKLYDASVAPVRAGDRGVRRRDRGGRHDP